MVTLRFTNVVLFIYAQVHDTLSNLVCFLNTSDVYAAAPLDNSFPMQAYILNVENAALSSPKKNRIRCGSNEPRP